jgi:hypothetical protein
MTKKEFSEKCKGIVASTELTFGQKEELIKHQAALLSDHTSEKTPEIRDFWKRYKASEKKLAGYNGFSYCPESGNWYPDRPTEIKALDREYEDITQRMADETARKALRKMNAEARA